MSDLNINNFEAIRAGRLPIETIGIGEPYACNGCSNHGTSNCDKCDGSGDYIIGELEIIRELRLIILAQQDEIRQIAASNKRLVDSMKPVTKRPVTPCERCDGSGRVKGLNDFQIPVMVNCGICNGVGYY